MMYGKIGRNISGGLVLAGFLALLFAGCASVPKEVPEDWTRDEINQRAQEFSDRKNYAAAIFLYETLLERHGTDPAVRVSADFEIGHILLKQSKWEAARAKLESVLRVYEENEGVYLPPEYRKLALIDLEALKGK